MQRPTIAMASLGGTITMVAVEGGSGVKPTLSVDSLLAQVPSIRDVADLQAETLFTAPGASLRMSDVLWARDWADNAVEQGASGVVIVQGTDTIEEVAYLLDLSWTRAEPIVVTGAMRAAADPGTDGPANILSAVRVAGSPAARGLGALVVLNDEVHAASRVRKVRASGPSAFASPGFGPVAFVEEARVAVGNHPVRHGPLTLTPQAPIPPVAIVEAALGDDGALFTAAIAAQYQGVVLAGFGVGHVSGRVANVVAAATQRVPVVLASRTGTGTTYERTYGFEGSESDLLDKGAIAAGWLDPRKARVLLSCLLAAGADSERIAKEFRLRGRFPSAALPEGVDDVED